MFPLFPSQLRRAATDLLRRRVAVRVGVAEVQRGGAAAADGGVGVHGDVGDARGGGHLQLRRQRRRQAPGMEARAPVQVGAPGRRRRRRREGDDAAAAYPMVMVQIPMYNELEVNSV